MAFLLDWSDGTKKFYENGVSKGVLFPRVGNTYPEGVAWYGLISVTESPEGAEATDLYANNVKYASMLSAETFKGSIEAYTYPPEWAACDGSLESTELGLFISQQARQGFGLAYRTEINSEAGGESVGYLLHLVYGAVASVSEKNRTTINESPEAATFSWEFTTTPVAIADAPKPSSKITIDSRTFDPDKLLWLEQQLYGDSVENPTPNLPLPQAIIDHVVV